MNSTSLKTNQCIATCPACGLLCDDIVLENNKVANINCTKAITFFEQPLNDTKPQINGKTTTLELAISHAAKLLKKSQQPIFTGLGTDVTGFRSLNNLAQKTHAALHHTNAQSLARNSKVLQSTGWQTTTLTEVKNRADVIVCFGGDLLNHNPRFFERFIDCDGMFVTAKNRQVIVLGNTSNNAHINSDALQASWILPCRADDLPSATIALRALVAGKVLKATEIAGIKVSDLQKLADKLRAAKYAVLVWAAKDLDFAHAELTIQNITETVAILNNTIRAAGLPLGGSDGDTSINYAHTWLNGTALQANIHRPSSAYDMQVFVNSFDANNAPQQLNCPLIVLGNASVNNAEVFIPIATPGLDCGGTLFRVDGAVSLPLKKVRENNLPTLSKVLSEIEKLL
jgi:formylmethanofuran dehydrogenase subunit B